MRSSVSEPWAAGQGLRRPRRPRNSKLLHSGAQGVRTEAYKVPFKFTGKIAKVTIELKEMKAADAGEAVQARKVATLKKGLSD